MVHDSRRLLLTAKYRIVGSTFTLEQLGQNWSETRTTSACELVVRDLPAQGI